MLSCSVWKTCGVDHVRTSSKLVSSVGIGTIGYINTILKGLLAFAVSLADHILRDLIEAHLSDIYCSRGWSCHLTYLTTALRGIQASLPPSPHIRFQHKERHPCDKAVWRVGGIYRRWPSLQNLIFFFEKSRNPTILFNIAHSMFWSWSK